MTAPSKNDNVDLIVRGLVNGSVRSIDEESRTATFVAATETGVDTYSGKEYLRVAGADLKRYRRNPVVLDTHNRFEAGAIIGKATLAVEDNELVAAVTFAETQRAEDIWTLVRGGFLRALSVGFLPRDSVQVEDGKTAKLGESEIEGPARLVKKWELYEISVVPVPADPNAIRRQFIGGDDAAVRNLARSLIQAAGRFVKEPIMADKIEPASVPAAPAPPPTQPEPISLVAAREYEPVAAQIRKIAPPELQSLANELVLGMVPFDEARKRMLAAYTQARQPVGTPEPSQAPPAAKPQTSDPKVSDMSADVLVRSLCGY